MPGKLECRPPKHFRTALGQLVNFFYTVQGECYSKDTQVLTDSGWKYFYDVTKDDKVYTLNNKTNAIELQKPVKFYQFDYNGELYNYKELRGVLGESSFISNTDTEVVLKSYLKCLRRNFFLL